MFVLTVSQDPQLRGREPGLIALGVGVSASPSTSALASCTAEARRHAKPGANPTVCDLVKLAFKPKATPPRALRTTTRAENPAAA